LRAPLGVALGLAFFLFLVSRASPSLLLLLLEFLAIALGTLGTLTLPGDHVGAQCIAHVDVNQSDRGRVHDWFDRLVADEIDIIETLGRAKRVVAVQEKVDKILAALQTIQTDEVV
jgi:hypothetical protein